MLLATDGRDMESIVTKWVMAPDMDSYQQETEHSFHSMMNSSFVAGTMWKSSGIGVQLDLGCFQYSWK